MIDIGDRIVIETAGKIAKKDGRGYVIRGEWVVFKEGDIGMVVNKRIVGDKWLYKIRLGLDVVELYDTSFSSGRDHDTCISQEARRRSGGTYHVSRVDKDAKNNAEY